MWAAEESSQQQVEEQLLQEQTKNEEEKDHKQEGANGSEGAESQRFQTRHDTVPEPELCIICEDEERTIRLPCGHALLCEHCTKRLIHHEQPCPTCRVPFMRYYLVPAKELSQQPQFVSPQANVDFGRLQRMSFSDAMNKLVTRVKSQSYACYQMTCTLLVLFLLLIVFMMPLGMAIAEYTIGIPSLTKPCDKPLARWMVALGTLHVLSCINSVYSCFARRQDPEREEARSRKWKNLYQTVSLCLLILGAVFVYSSDSCDNTVYQYCWFVVTIFLSILGLLVFLFLLVLCLYCGTPQPQSEEEDNVSAMLDLEDPVGLPSSQAGMGRLSSRPPDPTESRGSQDMSVQATGDQLPSDIEEIRAAQGLGGEREGAVSPVEQRKLVNQEEEMFVADVGQGSEEVEVQPLVPTDAPDNTTDSLARSLADPSS